MSVIAIGKLISTELEMADLLFFMLADKKRSLGLGSIEYNSELIRRYPSVVITPGTKSKQIHGTHTFSITIECGLTVYHAKLTSNKQQRTREDLMLVNSIESLIEDDDNLSWPDETGEPRVQVAFVTDSMPGTITRSKGDAVVGTRMVVMAQSQRRFK